MSTVFKLALSTLLAVCLVLHGEANSTAFAQHPLEPSNTSSPRATLISFLNACNELYDLSKEKKQKREASPKAQSAFERMLDCLDLSKLPSELRDKVGLESAIFIKEVLDRIELPPDEDIPGEEAVAAETASEKVTRWRIPLSRLTIVKVQEGPNQGAYLFSPETVRRANSFYSTAKQLPYRTEGRRVSQGLYDLYVAISRQQPTVSAANTSSPRGTLTLFLDSADEIAGIIRAKTYFSRSDPEHIPIVMRLMSCLDLSEMPEYAREYYAGEAIVCIKEILDRVAIPSAEEIPGAQEIEAVEGKEKLLQWQIPHTQLTIARVQEGPRRGEYVFSSESVRRAPEFYEKFKMQPYRTEGREVSEGLHSWWLSTPGDPTVRAWVDQLPGWVQNRLFGMAFWQWFGLLLTIPIGIVIMVVAFRIGKIRSEVMRKKSLLRYWVTLMFPITAMLVPLAFSRIVYDYLTIRGSALYVASFSADIVFLLALLAVIVGGSNRIAESFVALPHIRPQGLDAHLIRILCRVLGIVAAVIVFLEGGRYLGFPLTTLLASAGIGGLAIALSAQGMIKGLFGTVTILMDRPFRVGERIIVRGQDGFVEEIGLRSTKIRTFLTNHLVSIPNDQIADSEIENIGRRKHIRRMSDIHIPLDTSREKVENAVAVIRAALDNHEGMDPEFPPRVYFNDFNTDSFNIRVIYWFQPPKLWDFYAFNEKLNLKIFRAFEEHGIQFSLPFRHTYWKTDSQQGPLDVKMIDDCETPNRKTAR